MRKTIAAATALLSLSTSVPQVLAQEQAAQPSSSNIMFIFDSSGSMKKKLANGESRSDAAKRALVQALTEMPKSARLGLLMYGHRRAKDCRDIEIVAPIGTTDGVSIASSILTAAPKGETPIATSLERAAQSLAPLAGQSSSIVLVTDGIEECGGDPCAAAAAIREMGIGLKAHVVGFTLNEKQRQSVQCIADETGGKYFDAQNATGLTEALAEVQKEVVEAPAPAFTSLFLDEFDGNALQPHWQVANVSADSDDDSHAVAEGELLMSITRAKTDDPAKTPYYQLDGFEPPAADWLAQATVEFGVQTAQETFAAQLRKEDTVISAELAAKGDVYYGWTLFARIEKKTGAEVTGFEVPISSLGCNVCKEGQMLHDFAAKLKQPIELQLVKEGRSYFARARQAGDADWIVTDKVTLLGGGGKLALSGIQREANAGESYAFVKRFEVLAPQ
jgi:Mg-chelatase subunit ChlD